MTLRLLPEFNPTNGQGVLIEFTIVGGFPPEPDARGVGGRRRGDARVGVAVPGGIAGSLGGGLGGVHVRADHLGLVDDVVDQVLDFAEGVPVQVSELVGDVLAVDGELVPPRVVVPDVGVEALEEWLRLLRFLPLPREAHRVAPVDGGVDVDVGSGGFEVDSRFHARTGAVIGLGPVFQVGGSFAQRDVQQLRHQVYIAFLSSILKKERAKLLISEKKEEKEDKKK